jgi:NADH-quinone oxidoreductase subunit E
MWTADMPTTTDTQLLIAALSPEETAEIAAEIAHVPEPASAMIEALRIVQRHRGWVSDQSVAAIARMLGTSTAAVDSVATFYNLIFRKPVGRHVVMYCDSVSCYVMRCDQLRVALEKKLGLETGETTADGRFTLLPIVCLGACDHAPVMMIDQDLILDVAPQNLETVFGRYT